MGQNTFSEGQGFAYYYTFKTIFLGHNKICGDTKIGGTTPAPPVALGLLFSFLSNSTTLYSGSTLIPRRTPIELSFDGTSAHSGTGADPVGQSPYGFTVVNP